MDAYRLLEQELQDSPEKPSTGYRWFSKGKVFKMKLWPLRMHADNKEADFKCLNAWTYRKNPKPQKHLAELDQICSKLKQANWQRNLTWKLYGWSVVISLFSKNTSWTTIEKVILYLDKASIQKDDTRYHFTLVKTGYFKRLGRLSRNNSVSRKSSTWSLVFARNSHRSHRCRWPH